MSQMYCPSSGKLRFQARADAHKASECLMRRKQSGTVRPYRCESCKDWHIANDTKTVNPRK